MSDRKSIILRIDPRKLKALEKWAADELRSTNAQIEYILDQALRKSGRYKGKREEGLEEEEYSDSTPQPPQGGD
jgi:hypothetical protein